MRILVDVGHPAHVHFFKNFTWNMEKKGHKIKIVARDKDITMDLLDSYGLEYEALGKTQQGLINKGISTIVKDIRLYKIANRFRPDIITNIGGLYITHVGKLLGRPSIVFTDSEPTGMQNKLSFPFCSVICTPSCFRLDLGEKHVRYEGYHELAYLHPNRFKPDVSVLDELNLNKEDKIFILRFVAWEASHDIGHSGFSLESKTRLVKDLEKYGKVLITSEKRIPKNLSQYAIGISPIKIHNLLAYASLLIGDTQTMTTEAAMVGTPAIRCNSFVGKNDMGNFIELEKKYKLIFNYTNASDAIDRAVELASRDDLKKKWDYKKGAMLKDKIDVTKWMIDFIENYEISA